MQEFWDGVQRFFTGAGWTIVTFLAALVIGIIVTRLIMRLLRRLMLKSRLDKTLVNFTLNVIKVLLYLLLLFILAAIAKIPLTPLVTALGAGALAVGLALKDSLSNLANGVMLVGTKPFKEGDFVDIDGVAGTVKAVRMLTTELVTTDNKKITLPNSKITSASVVNYSTKPTRRVEWTFSVAYGSDIRAVKDVLLDCVRRHPKTLSVPEPMARLNEQGASSLNFLVRAWVNNADYWTVYFDVNEAVYEAFGAAGIEIPFSQLDVHLVTPPAPADGAVSPDMRSATRAQAEEEGER